MRVWPWYSVLLILVAGCEKPVAFERVNPRPRAPERGMFADGSVIREDLDAGARNDAAESAADEGEDDVPFTKRALLEATAQCALEHYGDFLEKAEALRDASAAWAEDRTDDTAAAARAAYRAAMASWQRAEPLNFGPAAPSSSMGGRDLGDKIYYPYPSIDRCRIDQQLVDKRYAAEVVRAAGLSAFEYLAYYVGAESSCAPQISIVADGSWDALSADERAQRRADFAAALASDIAERARELVEAWLPDKGNFYAQLSNPGPDKIYKDEQDALNNVNYGLYYVDTDVKDIKLGRPLGKSGCSTTTCPNALESPLSGLSAANVRENLIGLRQLFQGCKSGYRGLGFDDWLRAADPEGDLAERMLGALSEAQASADALDSLERALVSDPASALALYDKVKSFTDLLKSEFITVTGLEPPKGFEGDND